MKKKRSDVGKELTVSIERLDDDGQGVGHAEHRTVAVQGALPGDVVKTRLTWASATTEWSRGELLSVVTPSPARVPNTCAHAPDCVGCPLRALDASAQLREKEARLQRALLDENLHFPIDPIVPAPSVLGYRSRAKYVVDGHTLGAYAPGTHSVVPSQCCEVVDPAITRAAQALQSLLPTSPALRYAVMRTNRRGQVLCAFIARERGQLDGLAKDFHAKSGVVGVVEHFQPDAGNAIFNREHMEPRVLVGESTLLDEISGVPIRLGATAFTQLHPTAADALVAHVAKILEPLDGKSVLDAYCGLGAFAFALRGARKVLGVDDNAESIQAAQAAGIPNVTFQRADAAQVLQSSTVDAVVVDPPRKGLSPDAMQALVSRGPTEVVYVACEPRALARDLVKLQEAGYGVIRVTPFDLFPQTPEVETVVLLRRHRAGVQVER